MTNSDDLMSRFDDVETERDREGRAADVEDAARAARETGTDADAGGGMGESESDRTRSRSQYAMYLSEPLQDQLDQTFKRFNAERTLDDKPEVEKHKHFLEGLVRAGLEHPEREEYILEEYDR